MASEICKEKARAKVRIDTHAHLTGESLAPHAEEMVETALAVGVQKIVNICTDEASLNAGLALQKKIHGVVYNAAATTPHDVAVDGEAFFPLVKKAAEKKQLVALGETGLDYHYDHSPKNSQRTFLSRYFQLANVTGLPLIFHCRDAFEDLLLMAKEEYKGSAVLHCFTGTKAEARAVLDQGWFISFSGIITFKKSEALREVVQFVPLEKIFVETDAPYLAPQSKRGKQNEPAFILETYELIAELKKVDLKTAVLQIAKNASGFFLF